MTQAELLVVAIEAALAAGNLLRQGFGTSFDIETKSTRHNLVTSYDKAAERLILSMISQRFTSHRFLGEEGGDQGDPQSSTVWIIDPLDGTGNFAASIPIFSVSIAAAIDNTVVCGVVYQPMSQELFFAEQGKGSFLNGKPLRVSETKKLDDAFVATGFPYTVADDPKGCIETFARMARRGLPIRRLGSAALDLAYLAAGRFDAYWEAILQPWDFAAGALLVKEAEGLITDYEGKALSPMISTSVAASNGHLHPELLKEVH